jgi:hypothetical protein
MLLKEYIAALWAQWWPLMSCAAFTFLSIAIGLGSQHPRLEKWLKAWEWKLALCLAGFFFFISGYYAWREQHQRTQAAEDKLERLTKPKLSGEIISAASTSTGPKNADCVVTLTVHVINKGAQTILQNWDVELHEEGHAVKGTILTAPGPGQYIDMGFIDGDGSETFLKLYEIDHLIIQTRNRPIIQGSAANGWVQVLFPIPRERVLLSEIVLSFSDVNGYPYSLTIDMKHSHTVVPPSKELEQEQQHKGKR